MQIYSDREIIRLIDEYMHGSKNPDLICYRAQTYKRDFANKERFLWALKHISDMGQFRGKRILDVGCGFGWQAFSISLLDSENRVVGLDILPSMIDGMSECTSTMRKKGVTFDLTPMCGDICDVNLEENSFDAIYSIEAIEHVHDMRRMVERCFTLLKPAGNLILVNDNNILNREVRNRMRSMWMQRENSWEWSDYLRSIRPIEHKDARPFAIMREEIVRASNPELTSDAVKMLVEATAGLLVPEIQVLAKNYSNGRPLPKRPQYDWCRNPITGEYAERLFDPFKLAELLRATGFETKINHFFRKFPFNMTNSIQFWPLNYALFNLKSDFILFAKKI